MRLYHRSSPILLILLQSYYYACYVNAEKTVDAAEGQDVIDLGTVGGSSSPGPPELTIKSATEANSGTKFAPFDGKDGRPHAGPFIETNAERDRKKAKESGDEEAVTSKPALKDISSKGASYVDDLKAPVTNDGVMDDPNRRGPKEGTRGTEGGISAKTDRKAQQGDIVGPKSEKKPDPPKEAPPLPHSEQEKVGQEAPKDPDKKGNNELLDKEEKPKELGGLEVLLPGISIPSPLMRVTVETYRPPGKTSRYPATYSANGIQIRSVTDPQTFHSVSASSCCHNWVVNSTPPLFHSLPHNDLVL